MNTISKTAFYCCGVRMLDAERDFSLIGDHFSKCFMDKTGREIFEPFRSETMPNISNAARCRIIDDVLREALKCDPRTQVVTIGAGFDTRPYRMRGGYWVEIDEAAIIDHKNEHLPVTDAVNPLTRTAIDFSAESLDEKLSDLDATKQVVVVIEGVFMYLEVDEINATLQALRRNFPRHLLICDLMNKAFFDKYAYKIHNKLAAAGGTFTERPIHPAQQFLDAGYVKTYHMPTFRRARELGAMKKIVNIPDPVSWLLGLLMRDLNGYAVYCFQHNADS
jgi:methyltransferase (TIGR00027 family)